MGADGVPHCRETPELARRRAALVLLHNDLLPQEYAASEFIVALTAARREGRVTLVSLSVGESCTVPVPHAAVVSVARAEAAGVAVADLVRLSAPEAQPRALELLTAAWEGRPTLVRGPAPHAGVLVGVPLLAAVLDGGAVEELLGGSAHRPQG